MMKSMKKEYGAKKGEAVYYAVEAKQKAKGKTKAKAKVKK
jgi:hypothetical protein